MVTLHRAPLLVVHHDLLRRAFLATKQRHPFRMPAIVILPDHCHFIMELPDGDADFSTRIGLIKSAFSRALPGVEETISASRLKRRERGVWQRRFWEHTIRDEMDFQRHFDYIHYNPVKHGHAARSRDWKLSSFQRYIEKGIYTPEWGEAMPPGIAQFTTAE